MRLRAIKVSCCTANGRRPERFGHAALELRPVKAPHRSKCGMIDLVTSTLPRRSGGTARPTTSSAMPLCRIHHRLMHRVNNDLAWCQEAGIDRIKVCPRLKIRPAKPAESKNRPLNLRTECFCLLDQKGIVLCQR